MSFANKLVKSGKKPIHYVRCKDLQDRECYYFIIATHEKMRMFLELKDGEFDLHDYGEIIASGFGTYPSDSVKAFLLEKYDFDCTTLTDKK